MLRKLSSSILVFILFFSNFSIAFTDETELIIENNPEITESWSTDSPTPIENINPIPDIIITFQSPSYLTDKDNIQETYHCDNSKSECKINFDLSDTFWWYVPAKFACLNNFSFTTWEENKCNPNTIIFPVWTSSINFKIYEEDNPSNFKEKSITIVNEEQQNQSETGSLEEFWSIIDSGSSPEWQSGSSGWQSGSSGWQQETNTWSTNSWSIDSGTWELSESWSSFIDTANLPSGWQLEIPDVDIEIQSWLELIDWNYKCKNTDCKINLNLENLFTWTYDISNYTCLWDFWSGTFITIDTDKKCNPGYVNYGTWNFTIEAKISEKNNSTNFKTWNLSFYNWELITSINSWTWELSESWSSIIDPANLSSGWQSGYSEWQVSGSWWQENTNLEWLEETNSGNLELSNSWNLYSFPSIKISFQNPTYLLEKEQEKDQYYCDNSQSECKINFDLTNSFSWFTSSHYTCDITLPFVSTETLKCNPNTITFPKWDTEVWFKIYEKDNIANFTWKTIMIRNPAIFQQSNSFIDKIKELNLKPTAKITLQWTIWRNKELVWNKLICKNTTECSVNFDWSESNDPNNDKLEYFWDFWNWQFEEKANPKTVKYTPWKYKVKLKVIDKFWEYSEDYFFIEVYEKDQEVIILNENIIKFIKIIEALPNPVWKEDDEWIKIKNDSINFINIKWLEIDDKIWEWSKVYTIKDDFYLLPYQEKKLYKSETKLNLNNSFDEVNLIYNDKIIDSLVWNYEVPEWFVVKKELREKVKVLSVTDWDTIFIQFSDWTKEKLRFIWVDTPETKHPKKAVEKFGIEASNYTKSMLNWKDIELELDSDNYRDKYDRLLGYVRIDNINFNKLIIEKWYWRAYLYFPFKYSTEFAKAEKEAKKNKLWIWWDDEMKKEMQLLEKLEKDQILENEKLDKKLWFEEIITIISNLFDKENYKELILNKSFFSYFNLWMDKKEIQKENLKEFDLLLSDLLKSDKKTAKSDIKQEKILSYKTSKLKSGLKITWVTFPNSMITLSFDEIKLETKSNEIWNYTFLITENLKVGEYELQFLVSNWWQYYNYLAPRNLILSKDYIFWIQDYKIKQLNKKIKKKKAKKAKKKKLVAKKSTLKKMKYDIKDIKKEEDKSPSKNIILIFLLSILVSIMWFFVIKKVD